MRTENTLVMNSPLDRVFALAAEVDHWPELLPHYRWVNTFWQSGDTSVVEMAARRGWFPVKWTSVQRICKSENCIYYKHIGGITRGMWVEWRLEPVEDGTKVTIIHEMTLALPIVRSIPGAWIVGNLFVKRVADETLRHIRSAAEE